MVEKYCHCPFSGNHSDQTLHIIVYHTLYLNIEFDNTVTTAKDKLYGHILLRQNPELYAIKRFLSPDTREFV